MKQDTAFSEEQINKIKLSPYVEAIHHTRLVYSDQFRQYYYERRELGISPTKIMKECGLGPDIIGFKRIEGLAYRLNKYSSYEDYIASNNPKIKEVKLSNEQKLKYLTHRNELLEQENMFLKKTILIGQRKDIQ